MRRLLLAALFVAIGLLAIACADGDTREEAPVLAPPASDTPVFLALGDSIAAGEGASDPAATGFIPLVAEALRERFGEGVTLASLAVPGHTTQALIDEQLPTALDLLATGDVMLVAVVIGGNDLQQYAADPDCVTDPASPDCPLEDGLLEVESRLATILGALHEAAPETAIVVLAYPNLFSGTGHVYQRQAEIAFDLLDGVIVSVARRYDAVVADARRSFDGAGHELSHLRDPTPDAHPNDKGHRVIAEVVLEALGLLEER